MLLLQAPLKSATEAKKPKATETTDVGNSGDKEENEDEKETAVPRRRSRRVD
jgi:hypothetical protein